MEAKSLEEIGFYTLSNKRASTASIDSPLSRCELIVTSACNFRCPYCRGIKSDYDIPLTEAAASEILDLWIAEGLQHVRFSGGEPTLWKPLEAMVRKCAAHGVKRIAISTNGSRPQEVYDRLLEAGVNDFSVSLDACCSSTGDRMAGGIQGAWETVVANIRYLAAKTYVTVGIVATDANSQELASIVQLAHDLGVADIRIISAAQVNSLPALQLDQELLDGHPILTYRMNNMGCGRSVRGLRDGDSDRCPLVLDDIAVVGGHHFPCIVYLREGGAPIGKVGPNMRAEREAWYRTHNTKKDPICSKNCLDVCVDYNNKYANLHDDRKKHLRVVS